MKDHYHKILLAPDSFKNSLSAEEVASKLSEGIHYLKGNVEVVEFPFADGGEGSLEVIQNFIECETKTIYTFDAFLKPIRASYLVKNTTAYIESARVVGLELLDKAPDCYNASSFGLGLMIQDALEMGAKEIYIFLGGTATCDGGVGMAAALGYDFIMEKRVIERPLARDVKYISEFRTDRVSPLIKGCHFNIGCDVENVLLGNLGAVFTYASQKGANEEHLELLELGMENLRRFIKEEKGLEVQDMPGSGAAGGLGAGAILFLNGHLQSAFDTLSKLSGLEEQVSNADLVITGEGHIDMQSFNGKLISKIQEVALKYEKPVWLVSAIRSISEKEALKLGFERIYSLFRSMPKKIDVGETKRRLVKLGKNWAEEWKES